VSGGCCRIPTLRQQVQEYFSTAEFINGITADEGIAVGCAMEVMLLLPITYLDLALRSSGP